MALNKDSQEELRLRYGLLHAVYPHATNLEKNVTKTYFLPKEICSELSYKLLEHEEFEKIMSQIDSQHFLSKDEITFLQSNKYKLDFFYLKVLHGAEEIEKEIYAYM